MCHTWSADELKYCPKAINLLAFINTNTPKIAVGLNEMKNQEQKIDKECKIKEPKQKPIF